jgi:hypothetical protein
MSTPIIQVSVLPAANTIVSTLQIGAPGANGLPGANGSDANVTQGNIVSALGFSPIADAPNDGLTYARHSAAWVVIGRPSNSVAPTLSPSGETSVGIQLSVSNGTWTGFPSAYSYQWQQSTDASTWTDISGATASTFTPNSSYVSKYVRASVIASNGFGSSSSVFSDTTGELSAPPYPAGAIAAWHLNDDGTGNVSLVDSTGNGNDLTNNNGVTIGTGIIGGDGVFNGSNQWLNNATFPAFGTGDFTISYWFNQTTNGGYQEIFSTRTDGAGAAVDFSIGLDPSSNLFYYDGSVIGSYAFSLDQWYNVVAVNSSGFITVYVNANSVGSGAQFQPYLTTYMSLGAAQDGGEPYNGQIDEVGVWNRALSSTEVTVLYNSGAGLPYPA